MDYTQLRESLKRGKRHDHPITVPDKTVRRARKALAQGNPQGWIDHALAVIGSTTTHHRHGDKLLYDAVRSAESLLALLVEMQNLEE